MKIIIPMSGIGKRFVDVGYTLPKPLIRVCGKPIIEYVISMFPGVHEFIFICNEHHLQTTEMKTVLSRLKPSGKIVSISPHSKGPVFAVSQVFEEIKDDDEVMISYCDYFMEWDFESFQREIYGKNYDAAVPCYVGFHPHLIHGHLYAGVLTDGDGAMTDIREKHCFTEKPEDCHQSAGAYYFRKGSVLKRYFFEQMESEMNLNGEYYASTPYELLLRDKLKIYVPEIKRFVQFGTPEDLEDFEAWARYFAEAWKKEKPHSDIPPQRESFISIPVDPETEEFNRSRAYWEPLFRRML